MPGCQPSPTSPPNFGGRSITERLWQSLSPLLHPTMDTFEAGSGLSTLLIAAKVRTHTALEHNARYAPAHPPPNVRLIVRPLEGDPPWYAWTPDRTFDLILVDGPPGPLCWRGGILRHVGAMAHRGTIIVVDDIDRAADAYLAQCLQNQFPWLERISFEADAQGRAYAILAPVGRTYEIG